MSRVRSTLWVLTAAFILVGAGRPPSGSPRSTTWSARAGAPPRERRRSWRRRRTREPSKERRIALEEHAAGDDVGAVLHAQRAVAAYEHALAVVRLARATTELADAQKALDDATTQLQGVEASRAQLEREASALDEKVRQSRERLLPASSAPATGEREEARLVAARALAVEARLLCGAARLVAADAAGLADADGEVGKLDRRLSASPRPAPIRRGRSRARALPRGAHAGPSGRRRRCGGLGRAPVGAVGERRVGPSPGRARRRRHAARRVSWGRARPGRGDEAQGPGAGGRCSSWLRGAGRRARRSRGAGRRRRSARRGGRAGARLGEARPQDTSGPSWPERAPPWSTRVTPSAGDGTSGSTSSSSPRASDRGPSASGCLRRAWLDVRAPRAAR